MFSIWKNNSDKINLAKKNKFAENETEMTSSDIWIFEAFT